ncbi:hypothetical protein OAG50_04605 [Akkermansiaceae bacterium]|nr:hypothetical protein [Akkermansiaceae bacterium]MDB4788469.1 hypothetical protein [Akkermansiaceae bacterium]
MKESLMSDQIIVSARTLVKRIRPNGSSPVAMRIRRAGDQLEVLVRYDARGEVSLKSSVENVTEKTGVTKDKGSTRAKTLGSFIGAKGFTVDPYVSYSNDFKKGDLGAARSYSLELEHKKEDKETTGTRIRIPAKAENPRIYFPGVVPPLSKKGTFRLRARYYVPTTNKSIVGIQFSQSAGPLPGGIGGKKGAWADLEFTYEATAEADGLFFYHVCSPDVPVAARAGEYASLAELTITHESFSAYLVERFDEHGAVAETSAEAANQKAVVTNGILLPF